MAETITDRIILEPILSDDPKDFLDKLPKDQDANTLNQLGVYSYYGNNLLGIPQSYIKAKEYWEQAAQKGHINARNNIGLLYYRGDGVERNYKEAKKCWEEISDLLPTAQFNLALLYAQAQVTGKPEYETAKTYLEPAAKKGHPGAQYQLGILYSKGILTKEPDYKQAKIYLEQAANQGSANAHYTLGELYALGHLTEEPDYKQAKTHYELAAKKSHPLAQHSIALIYARGRLTGKPDYPKAIKHFKLAIKDGSRIAKHNLERFVKLAEQEGISVGEGAEQQKDTIMDDQNQEATLNAAPSGKTAELTARGTPRVYKKPRKASEVGGDLRSETYRNDVKLSGRVSRELRDKFVACVEAQGTNQGAVLTELIENYLEEHCSNEPN